MGSETTFTSPMGSETTFSCRRLGSLTSPMGSTFTSRMKPRSRREACDQLHHLIANKLEQAVSKML